MKNQKRIRDYNIVIGEMKPGRLNAISDVKGVKVGHCTVDSGEIQSGVTAIIPAEGNLFKNKVMASSSVMNGFGKSVGLIQIEEMGSIETPILLTNTLCVGSVNQALVEKMVEENEYIANTTSTVNPVICECNDSYLNNRRKCTIGAEHVAKAIADVSCEFEEGSVGAGRGMSCYRLKGGIGSASRQIEFDEVVYHLGSLVLSNMGLTKDLIVNHKHIGKQVQERIKVDEKPDAGSIIVIIACDIPLSERQLKRICNRAIVGISRTGGYLGNGSGEIAIAFSTHNRLMHEKGKGQSLTKFGMLFESEIDMLFRAAIESVEEAILNSLITAERVVGFKGHTRAILKDFADLL